MVMTTVIAVAVVATVAVVGIIHLLVVYLCVLKMVLRFIMIMMRCRGL
jgi:hypothetical protein